MTSIDFNKSPTTVEIDYEKLVAPVPAPIWSPIDSFYAARDWSLSCSGAAPFKGSSPHLQLLLPFIFSSAEVYFRAVLSRCVSLCPISAELASSQPVAFGAAQVFKPGDLGLVIKDTTGLTSAGEVSSRTNKLLGIQFKQNSSEAIALIKFDQACHVRHAVVHSGGELLYNNRSELGVGVNGRCAVALTDRHFQDLLQTVVNAVRAYNVALPNFMLDRWFDRGVVGSNWTKDRRRVEGLWSLFASASDGLPEPTARAL